MLGAAADEEAERQLREVQEVFALFDVDGSGSLSADEVGGRHRLACWARAGAASLRTQWPGEVCDGLHQVCPHLSAPLPGGSTAAPRRCSARCASWGCPSAPRRRSCWYPRSMPTGTARWAPPAGCLPCWHRAKTVWEAGKGAGPAPEDGALLPSNLHTSLLCLQISCEELLQYVLSLDEEEGDEEQGRAPSSGDCMQGPRCSAGREPSGRRPPS